MKASYHTRIYLGIRVSFSQLAFITLNYLYSNSRDFLHSFIVDTLIKQDSVYHETLSVDPYLINYGKDFAIATGKSRVSYRNAIN